MVGRRCFQNKPLGHKIKDLANIYFSAHCKAKETAQSTPGKVASTRSVASLAGKMENKQVGCRINYVSVMGA